MLQSETPLLFIWSSLNSNLNDTHLFHLVVNGSVTVFIGETIIVKEDVRVTVDCSQLIDTAINKRISNITVIWYKDRNLITNGTAANTVISADHRLCITTNTLQSEGGRQLGTDGDYTCKVCNATTCINMTSPQIICGRYIIYNYICMHVHVRFVVILVRCLYFCLHT